MSLSALSPLTRSASPKPAMPKPVLPGSQEPVDRLESEPASGTSTGHKVLAGAMLGLTGLSVLGGVALHQAATAPVCQQTQQVVGWESGRLCVSHDVAMAGSTAWRMSQVPFHTADALNSWESGQHIVFAGPQNGSQTTDGESLQVVSWNLHHGLSSDATGARPQLDTMVDTLKAEEADVYLLQEVDPKFAGDIAEQMGMTGYYAVSTPVQGNLILINPDIEVREAGVAITAGARPGDGVGTLADWLTKGAGEYEPRNLQVLDVTLPSGQQAVLWNTHHPTSKYSEEQHQQAAQAVRQTLESRIQPGELVIGGGDLNAASANHPLLQQLGQVDGLQGHHDRIDWIYTSEAANVDFSSTQIEHNGSPVSDHPLVRATVTPGLK